MAEFRHLCADSTLYSWRSRVKKPKECPRCKKRLDLLFKGKGKGR